MRSLKTKIKIIDKFFLPEKMAIRKKGKRKIKFGEYVFYYSCRHEYPDNILTLRVMTEEKAFSHLVCKFNHKDFWLYFSEGTGDTWVITPSIIRQSIEYGLANGWHPYKKGKHFIIKDMDKILGIKSSDK